MPTTPVLQYSTIAVKLYSIGAVFGSSTQPEVDMAKKDQQANKAQQKKAVAEYKNALSALHSYRCDAADDPTYLKLNGAANEAAKKLPWWRR
jgi:hypothetical protein